MRSATKLRMHFMHVVSTFMPFLDPIFPNSENKGRMWKILKSLLFILNKEFNFLVVPIASFEIIFLIEMIVQNHKM